MESPLRNPEGTNVLRDAIKEHRGDYFVSYKPADVNSSIATVYLAFLQTEVEIEAVKRAMEEELKYWLNRYRVPLMVSAFDAKDSLIGVSSGMFESHLMGYVDAQTGGIVKRWGLFENDELPSEQTDAKYLERVYVRVPFRIQDEVRKNAMRKARTTGSVTRLIVFLVVVVPVLIELVSLGVTWLGHLLAAISISVGLYKAGKAMGWIKPSQRDKEKAEKDLKMRHYFYHCEQNPEAFNRLKIENFERESIKQTHEEAERIEMSAKQTSQGLTPSERFVTTLCQRSFLKLWTHPNSKGRQGRELCDCLVVCGPHIVIISVKDNEYRQTGDSTGWERWTKAAIEKSVAQISGAERWLKSVDKVERRDGRVVTLPERSTRRYHRVAVALGGRGHVPLKWGDLGSGFVHVCDEYSVGAFFTALDTISDFVGFLEAVEGLLKDGVFPLFAGGGIEDLIALYVVRGRSFDLRSEEHGQPDMLVLCDDLWGGLLNSDEFKRMQADLKQSYVWDRLIDNFADDLLTDGMFDMHSKEVTKDELALVTMALEPRMHRAVLADTFIEFFEKPELKSAARMVQGSKGHAYVFMAGKSEQRDSRTQELALRCLVVRGRLPDTHTVVGIATDRPGSSKIGYSSDIVYIHMPEWKEEAEKQVCAIQEELGYFKNMSWSKKTSS